MKKMGYSKYKIGIKVQRGCVFLSLHKWSCLLYTPRTKNFKCSLPRITFPNSSIKFNSSIGWINTRSRTDLAVYWSTFFWWFLYRTITWQIIPSLLGTIPLTMPYRWLLLSTPSCFKNNTASQFFMSWSVENHLGWFISLDIWDID